MPAMLAAELWSEVKRYISSVDKEEAAETVVNLLIDNDIDADEIRQAFKGDSDIKRALQSYIAEPVEDDEEVEDEDEDDYY